MSEARNECNKRNEKHPLNLAKEKSKNVLGICIGNRSVHDNGRGSDSSGSSRGSRVIAHDRLWRRDRCR